MRYVPGVGFEFVVKRPADRLAIKKNRVYVTIEQLLELAGSKENIDNIG